jgi:hypothetical protein
MSSDLIALAERCEAAAASCDRRALALLESAAKNITCDREVIPLCKMAMELLDMSASLRARAHGGSHGE